MSRVRISTTVDADEIRALREWAQCERLPLGRMLDLAVRRLAAVRGELDVVSAIAQRRSGRPTASGRARELELLGAIRRRGGRPLRQLRP